jgi:hypothetical protein
LIAGYYGPSQLTEPIELTRVATDKSYELLRKSYNLSDWFIGGHAIYLYDSKSKFLTLRNSSFATQYMVIDSLWLGDYNAITGETEVSLKYGSTFQIGSGSRIRDGKITNTINLQTEFDYMTLLASATYDYQEKTGEILLFLEEENGMYTFAIGHALLSYLQRVDRNQ